MGRGTGRRVSEIRARAARPGTGRTILNLAVGACVSPTDSIITTCASVRYCGLRLCRRFQRLLPQRLRCVGVCSKPGLEATAVC